MDRYEHLNDTRVVAIEVTPMWSGDLPISAVNEALKAVGLDEKLFPSTPSRAKAMRRAFEALAPRGSRIDSLPKGMGVSMSIKNSSKLDLQELQERTGIEVREAASYYATLTAKITVQNVNGTEIEEVNFTPYDHPMVPLLRETYAAMKDKYKMAEDLSWWFSQVIIPAVGGVGKRSRGGVYYVPASRKEVLVKCAKALDNVSQTQTLVRTVAGLTIPVQRLIHGGKLCLEPRYGSDAAAMEILVDGVIRETDNAIDSLTEALSAEGDKALGKRALKTKRRQLAKLEAEITEWETTASMSLELLRNRLEEARSVLGIAELAAEAESLRL